MSMSTHLVAFTPDTDPEYQKHLKVWNMCEELEVSLPAETYSYFLNGYMSTPEEKLEVTLEEGEHYKEWEGDMQEGFEVDLTKLPKGVTKLRFYNSY